MRPSLVDDDLWELIKPLLPNTTRRYRHPDRRRIDDRKGAERDPVRVRRSEQAD